MESSEQPTYMYGRASADDHASMLKRQQAMYGGITESLLRRAGIGPGMTVLDVGSGTGDVAFTAIELVGNEGKVVCVEHDARMAETIRSRSVEAGVANIVVVENDFHTLDPNDHQYDAIVGRLVLMHQTDCFASIRSLASLLRPGGAMAFVELAHFETDPPKARYTWQFPLPPAWDQAFRWFFAAAGSSTGNLTAGLQLPAAYAAAGLTPNLELETVTPVLVGNDLVAWWTGVFRNVLPLAEATGVVPPGSIDIDKLVDELRESLGGAPVVGLSPPLIAAWARKPG